MISTVKPNKVTRIAAPLRVWHESVRSARTDDLIALGLYGAFIAAERELPEGTRVKLEFALGNAEDAPELELDAVVCPVESDEINGESGFGVRFEGLSNATRNQLKEKIDEPEKWNSASPNADTVVPASTQSNESVAPAPIDIVGIPAPTQSPAPAPLGFDFAPAKSTDEVESIPPRAITSVPVIPSDIREKMEPASGPAPVPEQAPPLERADTQRTITVHSVSTRLNSEADEPIVTQGENAQKKSVTSEKPARSKSSGRVRAAPTSGRRRGASRTQKVTKGESGLRLLRQALKHSDLKSVLKLPKGASQTDLFQSLHRVRKELTDIEEAGVRNADLLADVQARVSLLREQIHNRMTAYVLLRAIENQQPASQEITNQHYEKQFLRKEVTDIIWNTWSAHDPRRDSVRVPVVAEIIWEKEDGKLVFLPIEDISSTGIALKDVPENLNPPTMRVQIALSGDPDAAMPATLQLKWQRSSRAGFKFVGNQPEDAFVIEDAIRSHYQSCLEMAEKFSALNPTHSEAISCLWQARFFCAEDGDQRNKVVRASRKEARDKNAGELWLALAKITLLNDKPELARTAWERAKSMLPRDIRVAHLDRVMTLRETEHDGESNEKSGLFTAVTGVFKIISGEASGEHKKR